MELDDLKKSWEEASSNNNNTEMINLKLFDKMTQQKYKSRMNRVLYPEIIGTVVSTGGAIYLLSNWGELNSNFLRAVAVFVLAFMLIMPAASLFMLYRFYKMTDVKQPFTDVLKKFTVNRIRFYKFQRLNAYCSYVFLVAVILIMPALLPGRKIPEFKDFWMYAFPLGFLFLYFFSKWVLKKYNRALRQSEALLKEIN